MVYVGNRLYGRNRELDPALIDPALRVDHRRPDWAGESMDYWPSYSGITPAARSAYLAWLAGGRSNSHAYIGYVFLFFYGLERRLLVDYARGEFDATEYEVLTGEVRRLLSIYRHNSSFRGYATALLDAAAIWDTSRDMDQPPAPPQEWVRELPMRLRIGLGRFAVAGKPIPADWALAWYQQHPETYPRTPAQRCPDEFRELFTNLYRQKFGDGMLVRPNKTTLSTDYYAASDGFNGEVKLRHPELPDVAKLTSVLTKLSELAEQATDKLDAYSRYLGRNPSSQNTPGAIALLPAGVTHRASPESEAFWSWAATVLGDERQATASTQELVAHWPTATDRLAKADAVSIAQLLERRGLGIEPDVRFGGSTPSVKGSVVLFRRAGRQVSVASAQYFSALAIINLGTLVASADGTVSEPERRALRELAIEELGLSEDEQLRLDAHAAMTLANPPTPAMLRRRVAVLSEAQRSSLGDLLLTIAAADGAVTSDEIRTLERLFGTLGLNTDAMYSTLHGLATATIPSSNGKDQLSSIPQPGTTSAAVTIPDRPVQGGEPSRLALDPALITAKRAESARAAAHLAAIFTDEDDTPAATPPRQAVPAVRSVAGLDDEHTRLFHALVDRQQWSRAEFEELATSFGLMPDGALETVNDAAFDTAGEALCEGTDPIEINQDTVEEIRR